MTKLPATIRQRFEMPEGVYLLSHSVGCQPVAVRAALIDRFLGPWAVRGSEGWQDWLKAVGQFREAAGRLLGMPAAEICPQTNLSSALSKIIHALPRKEGRTRIVMCEEDFPSLGFVAAAAERTGLEIDFMPRGEAATDPDKWKAKLEGAWLAIVTHAFSNRSARLPVPDITAEAREQGVFTVVDAVQTTGVIPYKVSDWQADFVLGTCVKFLCGGPGAGYMWGRPETVALCDPLDTGWFSHADPFAFQITDYRQAEGVSRFWGGTPSIAPFVTGAVGIETLLDIGIETVHRHNQDLIDRIHAGLPEAAIASERKREARGNAVLIRVADDEEALAHLRERGISADRREGAIRVSPHLYTSTEDIEWLIEQVSPLL